MVGSVPSRCVLAGTLPNIVIVYASEQENGGGGGGGVRGGSTLGGGGIRDWMHSLVTIMKTKFAVWNDD